MGSRKSAQLTAKAEAVTVATTQLKQKEKLVQPLQKQVNVTEETTKKAQGSRIFKKRNTSNEKDASYDNAIADHSNRNKTKGKRGNSKFMKDIPFDILLEIFSLLEPVDLLHLSRVSKSLHDLLASNVFLWKLSYKNVDQDCRPPPCPNDTNIVFYTNYLYGRHCQFCSSIYGRIYHETAFIRLCSKCAETSFLSLRFDEVDPVVRHLCNRCNLPEYKGAGQMILKVEYSLRLKELKHAQKEKRASSYLIERERLVNDRVIFGCLLTRWRQGMRDIQRHNLRMIRYKRAADIKKKLEEEGYKADFVRMSYQVHIPHFRKSHGLTDSEWSFIRADILDFFQDIREDRAVSDIRDKLRYRISQLERFISRWKIHPRAWWIASSEPIASLMKSELPEGMPEEDFEKVEPQLHNIITSWREETDRYLATLIPQPSGKGKKKDSRNNQTSALELATTFFKCDWCTEPISYPRILMHGCLLKDVEDQEEAGGGDDDDKGDMEDLEGDTVVGARGPRAPRPPKEIAPDTVLPMLSDYYSLGMCAGKEGVSYDEEASNAARDIITACGQDPMTVTYAAMEEMHARLECLRCSRDMRAKQKTNKSVRLVMKWTMALVHELEEHYGESRSSEPAWGKINSLEDLAKVEDAEIKIKKLKKYQMHVFCNHCSWYGITQEQQLRHIVHEHNIIVDKVTVSDHFSPRVDESIKMLYPAVKI